MRLIVLAILFLSSPLLFAQKLQGPNVKVDHHPESVFFDGNFFYVSNLGKGATGKKDSDGYISVLDKKGRLIKKNFIPKSIKLHTPTGMAMSKGYLFVVDMDRIVALPLFSRSKPFEIDLSKTKANFLNDIVFVSKSHVVVTESMQKKLYLVNVWKRTYRELPYDEDLGAPNGIDFDPVRKVLFVAANKVHAFGQTEGNGQIITYRFDSGRSWILKGHSVVSWGRFIDGITLVPGTDRLLVSDWNTAVSPGRLGIIDFKKGKVLYQASVSANGFADFGFDPSRNLIVAPDLIKGLVYFYRLK